MADGEVVDRVAARLTLDITPAQQALKQLEADYQTSMGKMSSTGSTSATGNPLYVSEKELQARLSQLRLDGLATRSAFTAMANQEMLQAEDEFEQKLMNKQRSADLTIEQRQQKHLQSMLQSQQLYEERMAQMQAKGSQQSGSSGGFLSNMGSHLLSETGRYAIGTAAGMTTFAVLDQLAKIPQTVSDVSASMAKLKQVLEIAPDYQNSPQKLTDDLKQLQDVAGMMAQAYGVDFSTVLDTMSQAGRKFKDVSDIVVATDSALQLTAVDAVPASQSISAMEAVMSQFGLSTSGARQALYEITAAAHEFQTTGSDLADAIERSGASFNNMRMNTAQSIAAIATLAQMTAQSGSTIGNAWKSIENSLGSDKAVKALKELGINVYDANGNLKDSVQILQDLQGIWPKLSDQAKTHFASIVAGGKYQYGRLESFLDDYSGQYQRALNAIQQANQQQQQQLVQSAMDSIPKQFDMTKASFQVMATTLATQVTPALIGALASFRNMDDEITNNIKTIDKYVKMGMTLVEAYALWKVGALAYNGAVSLVTTMMTNFNTRLEVMDAESAGTVTAFQNMSSAAAGMADSVGIAVMKMGLLAAAAMTINNLIDRANNPDQTRIDDLQSQLASLQTEQKGQSNGDVASKDFHNGKYMNVVEDIGFEFGQVWHDVTHPGETQTQKNTNLSQQITSIQAQLDAAKAKKAADDQQAMDNEMKKYQDVFKKYLDTTTPGPKKPPGGGPGDIPPPSGPSSTAAFVQPYHDAVTAMNEGLKPFINTNKELDSILSSLTNQQTSFADALKYGATNADIVSGSAQVYQQRLAALKAQQDSLHQTNDQIRQDMAAIADQLQSLNPDGADVTTLSQGQQQAISELTNQYDQLSQQLDQNSQKWWTDQRNITQATLDYLNAVIELQNNGIKPLTDAMHENDLALKQVQNELNLLDTEMKHFGTDTTKQAEYMTDYNKEVSLLSQQNLLLHSTNEQLTQDNADLKQRLDDLNTAHENGTITTEAYTAAAQQLNDQIQKNTDAMASNNDQWYQNLDAIQQAIDKTNQMNFDNANASIKSVIDNLKQLEQETIKPLDDQITAIDRALSNMSYQNKVQDNQSKLAQLQKEAAQWQASTSVEGRKKYTDYLKQIADLQKTMSRDAAQHDLETKKQNLEDQKSAVQQHFTDLENIYSGFADNVQSIDQTLQKALRASAGETNSTIKGYLDQTIQTMQTLQGQFISVSAEAVQVQNQQAQIQKVEAEMKANSAAWFGADKKTQKDLYDKNQVLGASIGAQYDPTSGAWTYPNAAGTSQQPSGSAHQYNMSDADFKLFIKDSQDWFHADAKTQNQLETINDGLRSKYGIPAGAIPAFATGGMVPGSGGVDSVLARLTPGEIVVPSFADLMKSVQPGPTVIQVQIDRPFDGAVFNNRGDIDYATKKLRVEMERGTDFRARSQGVRIGV